MLNAELLLRIDQSGVRAVTKKVGQKAIQNPNMDKPWFDKKLKERGASQRDLSKHLKMDPSTLHNTLMGFRKLLTEEAVEMAHYFNVPVTDVFRAAGLKIALGAGKAAQVRVVGWVDSAGNAEINLNEAADIVSGPPSVGETTVAVQFRAAGSDFSTMDGWHLFMSLPAAGVAAEAVGRLCLCKIKGGGHVVRFVKRGYKAGKYTLVGDNIPATVDSELEFAAPIAWMAAT
jgi:lambda repressor-like predicted transcriptional regulator